MSRSGYSDDLDQWDLIRWRGAVASAIRGRRGQAFLKEMLDALDAMPEKKLIAHDLQNEHGEVCALGSVGAKRGAQMDAVDPEDYDRVAGLFGVAPALVREVEYINDEQRVWDRTIGGAFGGWREMTPEDRWKRVRAWVASQITGAGE